VSNSFQFISQISHELFALLFYWMQFVLEKMMGRTTFWSIYHNVQHVVIHIEVRNSYNTVYYLFNTSGLMLSMIITLKYCQRNCPFYMFFVKNANFKCYPQPLLNWMIINRTIYVCCTINGEPLRTLSFRSPGDQNLVCVIRPLGQKRKTKLCLE